MSMKIGVPYSISNTVVEFEEGSVIAWQHFGRHIWRYRLEPVPGGTTVTEEFDYRRGPVPATSWSCCSTRRAIVPTWRRPSNGSPGSSRPAPERPVALRRIVR